MICCIVLMFAGRALACLSGFIGQLLSRLSAQAAGSLYFSITDYSSYCNRILTGNVISEVVLRVRPSFFCDSFAENSR